MLLLQQLQLETSWIELDGGQGLQGLQGKLCYEFRFRFGREVEVFVARHAFNWNEAIATTIRYVFGAPKAEQRDRAGWGSRCSRRGGG